MIRAAIYNRCSTDMEAQVSALETQVAESREIVQNMGWELVQQYIESESATTGNRPLYRRMLNDISEHRFDVLVVKSIDRINRNVRDFYFLLDCLMQNQVKLYLYLEGKYYESDDSLITGIKAILAEDFSRELSRKIRNSHERRQKLQTGFNITRAMFGWDRAGKDRFELNPKEAEYYRQGFDLAREGYGYRSIARIMFERGARTKEGRALTEVQWRNMLRTPRAHGEVILRRKRYDFERKRSEQLPEDEWIHIKNALAPILSEKEHVEILAILDLRANNADSSFSYRRGTGERGMGIFSGKLECTCCGKHYYRVTEPSAAGKETNWKCASYINYGKKNHSEAGCSNIILRETVLKELIWDHCRELFDTSFPDESSLAAATLDVLRKVFVQEDIPEQIRQYRLMLEKLLQRKERLLVKFIDAALEDEEFRIANQRMTGEAEVLRSGIAELEAQQKEQTSCENRLNDIRRILLEEKVMEAAKAGILYSKIEKIEVHPDGRLRIYFDRTTAAGLPETEFWYQHTTLPQERHKKHREQIYELMQENPKIKIREIMQRLDLSESYINLRIRELKKEKGIRYNRNGGMHCWETGT